MQFCYFLTNYALLVVLSCVAQQCDFISTSTIHHKPSLLKNEGFARNVTRRERCCTCRSRGHRTGAAGSPAAATVTNPASAGTGAAARRIDDVDAAQTEFGHGALPLDDQPALRRSEPPVAQSVRHRCRIPTRRHGKRQKVGRCESLGCFSFVI